MAKIQQGDSYAIKIKLRDAAGAVVSTTGVSGVQVKLGSGTGAITKEYPDGGLTYDSDTKKWAFTLTQAQTYALSGEVEIQAQVEFTSGAVVTTPVSRIVFDESIITKVWGD